MQDNQLAANWQVTCQCGWRIAGAKDVVVEAVQNHGREAHNVELTEEQVMAQAVPASSS